MKPKADAPIHLRDLDLPSLEELRAALATQALEMVESERFARADGVPSFILYRIWPLEARRIPRLSAGMEPSP